MSQDFSDLVRARRSCHHFLPGFKLTDEAFFEVLEDVRYTPSGYNAQPWEFVLIRDEDRLKEVHQLAFEQDHILSSGNLVVVLGNTEFGVDECEKICAQWEKDRGFTQKQVEALRASLKKDRSLEQKREMVIRNCALAAMTFLYSAENKGYITCPMMGFSQKKLAKLLELPEKVIPILLIAVGKPRSEGAKERRSEEGERLERKTAREIGYLESYPQQ